MKFLIVFVLALATVSAKYLHSRSVEVPVLENEGRIINGKNASPGQFKYQVFLILTKGSITEWCGGSLIGKNWVLTSALCTIGVSSAMVLLGATQRMAPVIVYNAMKDDIIIHPDFNPNTYENDISLIKIPTTSESSRIGIGRIPSNDDKHVGDSVVVSGWGFNSDTANRPTHNLKYGILKVSADSVCSEFFGRDFTDRTSICVATFNGVSACPGDTGGPLVLERQNLQIGLVSHGRSFCSKGFPVIFTRVGIYRFWIKSLTGITGISKL